MDAIILAAGKSKRMYPLTVEKPKGILKIANKSIIQHNLEQLEGLVDKAIIIVGHGREYILNHFPKEYKGLGLTYMEQWPQLGTWHALDRARYSTSDRFIVLMGDDLYSKKDIKSCIEKEFAILTTNKVNDKKRFGIVNEHNGKFMHVFEKEDKEILGLIDDNTLVNCGLYVLNKKVFEYNLGISKRAEFELTTLIEEFSKKNEIDVVKVQDYWIPINYPWDLLNTNEFLLKRMLDYKIDGIIASNVTIDGLSIVIGKGTEVKSGAYIEGPVIIGKNCKIGPRAYIRGCTSIGNNCRINAEVKNSIIGDNTNLSHQSIYVGDSIIGDDCNLGAGTITANSKHDGKNIRSIIYREVIAKEGIKFNREIVDTGRTKFGTVIGDRTKLGIGTKIRPGRKIWPNKLTEEGQVVKEDLI